MDTSRVCRILLALLFLSAWPASGSEPDFLHGQVVDGALRPIAGADLVCKSMPRPGRMTVVLATSGEDGRFRFDGLKPGRSYNLTVEQDGFLIGGVQGAVPSAEPLQLELIPEGVLRGRVLDGDGRPAPKVRVQAFSEAELTVSLPREFRRVSHATTDSSGAFELHRIPPDPVRLSTMTPWEPAEEPVFEVSSGETLEGIELRVVHDPVAEAEAREARAESVRRARIAEQRRQLDAEDDAQEPAGTVVEGRILGVTSADLEFTTIAAINESRYVRGSIQPDGTYRIEGLSSGTWSIMVYADDRTHSEAIHLSENSGVFSYDVEIRGDYELTGTVWNGGRTVAGARISLFDASQDPPVLDSYRVTADQDGRFQIEDLVEGSYKFLVTDPGLRFEHQRLVTIPHPLGLEIELSEPDR